MASVKSLAKDTAVYGLSSIIGRFLNWLLVPLYTNMFIQSEYGVVTYVYTIVAVALIILTYGMETGFFRFANHERYTDPMEVYSTAMTSIAVSSTAFFALVLLFLTPVSVAMECAAHPEYTVIMAATVALDAFTSLPFSYLRYKRRPYRFAALKLTGIALNIG
ncbi:MAG: oligosaccharide flippase family protein, partial [Paramuribaculum sp.]|nr:oligosaccharide flippase family protein [Paramuribaculum sp.]